MAECRTLWKSKPNFIVLKRNQINESEIRTLKQYPQINLLVHSKVEKKLNQLRS